MTDINITIIGAGVIGLAIASRLSKSNTDIYVVEKNRHFGEETSSRNSEVIHSGIYYPKGSLKARLCVRGNKMLYSLCERENIPYRKCGKLIVANSTKDVDELKVLHQKAIQNGVLDLEMMDARMVAKIEPHIRAKMALFSPSSGIIDSHSLMKYFEKTSLTNGVEIAYRTKVKGIKKSYNGYKIEIRDADGQSFSFSTSMVINCGGLEADKIAYMVGIKEKSYEIYFCKGEYFRVNPPANRLVNRLIYPVPGKKLVGLGIHATVDLNGGLKLGPSAFYLDKKVYDYSVNENNLINFYNSIKDIIPSLQATDLSPDMAGIRPKIQAPEDRVKDFIIANEYKRGYPGFINCIGIESPGLTSSPAIAEYVESLI